jgi:DNA mismatch repair ATPase MutL
MAWEQALEEIGLTFAQLSATSVMIRTVPRSVWEIRQATLMQEIEEILKQKALEQFSERVESALAKHSLPDEMPGLSAYDMRAMMASLDEVNVHVGWSVSPLWGSLNLSNAIHPIEP